MLSRFYCYQINFLFVNEKKIIFILIESAKRELNSKTLLALRALNKNYRVVIGHKGTIWSIFNKCNPGIVLLKSFGPKNTDTINLLKKKNLKFYLMMKKLY